ncbi:hypothetical protein FB45DRAFT_936340, partial [Roridomyces roridus]
MEFSFSAFSLHPLSLYCWLVARPLPVYNVCHSGRITVRPSPLTSWSLPLIIFLSVLLRIHVPPAPSLSMIHCCSIMGRISGGLFAVCAVVYHVFYV